MHYLARDIFGQITTDTVLKIMHLQFKVPGFQACYRGAVSPVISLSGITVTENTDDKKFLACDCFIRRF